MILNQAKKVYLGDELIKKIYCGSELVYSYASSIPPLVSEETLNGSSSADNYTAGSTQWGSLTLSSGCTISEDGIEFQDEQTYVSARTSNLSYPMTFEFKGRIDSVCYKPQSNNPGMLFGFGSSRDAWFGAVTCYATSDQGISLDSYLTIGKIETGKTPTYVHIIVTIDSSGALTFYLNGINNTWTASADNATRANKTYIYNGEGSGRFVGAISVMRWWSSQLSKEEIIELFSQDSEEYTIL